MTRKVYKSWGEVGEGLAADRKALAAKKSGSVKTKVLIIRYKGKLLKLKPKYGFNSIGLIRLSGDSQLQGNGEEVQRQAIKSFAKLHLCRMVYFLGGVMRGDNEYDELYEKLIAALETGEYQYLFAYSLPRIARTGEMVGRVLAIAKRNKVVVVGCMDRYRSNANVHEREAVLLHQYVSMEAEIIKLRTQAGKEIKREKGLKAEGRVPFGEMVVNGVRVLDPDEQLTIKMIADEVNKGKANKRESWRAISDYLNEHGRPTKTKPKPGEKPKKWYHATVAKVYMYAIGREWIQPIDK